MTRAVAALLGAGVLAYAAGLRADVLLPPWTDEGSVPPASWARSVAPRPGDRGRAGDLVLFAGPSRASGRRGVTAEGASLPLFAVRRGPGCTGPWWLVGPLAWTCSDEAQLAAGDPGAPARALGPDGLPVPYFFVRREGASAYASVETAEEGTSDRELEGGWAVAVVEERDAPSGRWARTSKGLWIATRDLVAARPSLFHGEPIAGETLDLAWVLSEHAGVWTGPSPKPKDKPKDVRARFEVVRVLEEHPDEKGGAVRVGDGEWMLLRDLARPAVALPPSEVTRAGERWVDVDLATQTLVAYEGARPVYATLVSTGRGPKGTDAATPPGVHRIWVKILAQDMDNVERGDVDSHYSMEDVPYVQFFDNAVALHGTYWHRDFGRMKSHGCVNLAPLDARWLFGFTEPRVPPGWTAAYPTSVDEGTVVRVR
jgi:hypothetical protein